MIFFSKVSTLSDARRTAGVEFELELDEYELEVKFVLSGSRDRV